MLILHLFLALLSFFIILGFRLMLVTLLVLTFLLGPKVLVFWLGSLTFLVLCTGLLDLLIWVILGVSFFGTSYPFRAMGWSLVAW